jgi:hypothetical protein
LINFVNQFGHHELSSQTYNKTLCENVRDSEFLVY